MPIPINFRKSAENVVASYSWSDISSGTGYVIYYGFDDEDNKALISSTIDSATGVTDVDYDAGAAALRFEDNFDLLFNMPQTIKGKLYISLTLRNYATTSNEVWAYINVYHYDGTTETLLATEQETTHLNKPSIGAVSMRTTLGFSINRHFKKGEYLRISIAGWGSGANNSEIRLYHDAGNRDFSLLDVNGFAVKSNLVVYVPFKIDL